MKVTNKEHFPEELKWVKFSGITWTHDNLGFFYQVRGWPGKEGGARSWLLAYASSWYIHLCRDIQRLRRSLQVLRPRRCWANRYVVCVLIREVM